MTPEEGCAVCFAESLDSPTHVLLHDDDGTLRTEQALETQPEIIAAGCPFCNTMMTDGVKNKEKEQSIKVLDIAELLEGVTDL